MSEHYQVIKACGICKKNIIADIFSIGTGHQDIVAMTHMECVPPGVQLLGDKVEQLVYKPKDEKEKE